MKTTLAAILLIIPVFSNSQDKEPEKQLFYAVGWQFGTYQYTGELANEMWRTSNLHGAGGVFIEARFNQYFDFAFRVSHGVIDYYHLETAVDTLNYSFKNSLYTAELGLKFKLNNGFFIEQDSRLSPYVFIGLGDILSFADHYTGKASVDFSLPVGWGFDYKLSPKWRLGVASTFHYTLTDNLDGWDRSRSGESGNLMDRVLYTGINLAYLFVK